MTWNERHKAAFAEARHSLSVDTTGKLFGRLIPALLFLVGALWLTPAITTSAHETTVRIIIGTASVSIFPAFYLWYLLAPIDALKRRVNIVLLVSSLVLLAASTALFTVGITRADMLLVSFGLAASIVSIVLLISGLARFTEASVGPRFDQLRAQMDYRFKLEQSRLAPQIEQLQERANLLFKLEQLRRIQQHTKVLSTMDNQVCAFLDQQKDYAVAASQRGKKISSFDPRLAGGTHLGTVSQAVQYIWPLYSQFFEDVGPPPNFLDGSYDDFDLSWPVVGEDDISNDQMKRLFRLATAKANRARETISIVTNRVTEAINELEREMLSSSSETGSAGPAP